MLRILFLLFYFSLVAVTFGSDTLLIKSHFSKILDSPKARNYENIESLNYVAEYIHDEFGKFGDSTSYQEFKVNGKIYKNVITSFGTENEKRIIVGAHYDVCGNQAGADDNASGVVGLLELARMLKGQKLNYRLDLISYTLEEPPYFGSTDMGSYVHSKYLYDNKIDVYGMICLEMIGYFSDEKNSQAYPLGLLKMLYGSKGDYITVIRKFHDGKFAGKYKSNLKKSKTIKTKSLKAPESLRGIDFSDHRNYWEFGFSSVLITNTGFYRNPNYHQDSDVLSTIDIVRMSQVIDEVFRSIIELK